MALTTTQTLPTNAGQGVDTPNANKLPLVDNFEPQKEPLYNLADSSGKPVNGYKARCLVTGDSSYPTGGYALSASMFGLSTIIGAAWIESESNTAWSGIITQANSLKLVAKSNNPNAAAEVTNATNVAAYSAVLCAFGY